MNHSTLLMAIWMFLFGYFAVNTFLPTNTPFHLNKVYMALQMVGFMLMFSFLMSKQYLYLIISIIFTFGVTYLIRNQVFITETEFLKGMTEHHQMALLMASKIIDKHPSQFTQNLSHNILKGQQKEIDEMRAALSL